MNELTSQILLWAAYIAIVGVLAAPVVVRLVSNLKAIYKIRKHKKTLPGPLLGVVYPETRKRKK
jgi:hypothetical protein